ncbi:ArdC-like ssDNA-binding domain-containing protein [Achromobacter spanius]|uniref:ArdC-like ssDNA-binding domain-containing protein n=1 Tax=Achromobacter spanius TaxID=217203 RepID=UPI00380F7A6A
MSKAVKTTRAEAAQQSLKNALNERSLANYPAIFEGFEEKGIALDDIKPRENVFTYNAWLALGRQVRRGERGVKIVTWVDAKGKHAEGGEPEAGKAFRFPRTTTVFHVSQTDPVTVH